MYLAYFPGGVIKVGTSSFARKEEIIFGQGAVSAIFCRANGQVARQIEHIIGLSGVKTRVTADYKLKNLLVDRTKSEQKQILFEEFSYIRTMLEPEFKPP